MSRNGGLLIFFDEQQRREVLRSSIDGNHIPFSDALSIPDIPIKGRSVALLSFSETTIDYIAIVQKGKRVATSKSRIEFSDLVSLDAIKIAEVEGQLSASLRPYLVRSSRGRGGLVPKGTWGSLIDIIKSLRPYAAKDVDRLLSLVDLVGSYITGKVAEVLLQERDAFGTALDVFSGDNSLRKEVLGSYAPPTRHVIGAEDMLSKGRLELTPGAPFFLQGIQSRFFQEESAIQHDLMNFNGELALHQTGSSRFQLGSRNLEITYANRNTLEHTLGVDLIYYNERYDLFVLVQYKLMEEEGGEFTFRPDAQLDREIYRMDYFSGQFPATPEITTHESYRLNTDGFMLKLVPNRGLTPASGELIQGMYLTRAYTKFLLGKHGPCGPRRGSIITFDNAPRYLSNTDFTRAVQQGWIGTSNVQSQKLREIIQAYFTRDRALFVAYETGMSKGGWRRNRGYKL